ncbi:PilZ domain-containing protein [Gimesia panareensis]|uniref:PilZ domain protein n=1 Tax=Gimesia panareensis TaxID=2527978 RepID=A0A518AER3_9PLAN|nr:PilZ domain-containing protein [Gimesia panareensis]QDT30126.1 PilZ domain protein [Gimesia panareensis]QDU53215.1 PilZ domain protein [Gimesia panareensis]
MIDRRKSNNRRSGDERRNFERLEAGIEVRLLRSGSNSGHEPLEGTVCDVSVDGIRMLVDIPLTIEESLLVQVHSAGEHLFNSTAKVVWQNQNPSGKYVTGCELCVFLTNKQFKTLRDFLDSQAQSVSLSHNPRS